AAGSCSRRSSKGGPARCASGWPSSPPSPTSWQWTKGDGAPATRGATTMVEDGATRGSMARQVGGGDRGRRDQTHETTFGSNSMTEGHESITVTTSRNGDTEVV